MCSIIGGFVPNDAHADYIQRVWERSKERGDDAWGTLIWDTLGREFTLNRSPQGVGEPEFGHVGSYGFIGYTRGTPTHEWHNGEDPTLNTQPVHCGSWTVVHNGTIANDKELREEYYDSLGDELPWHPHEPKVDSWVIAYVLSRYGWENGLRRLKGSFAILAVNHEKPHLIHFATNYKPLFIGADQAQNRVVFASQRQYLMEPNYALGGMQVREVPPYSYGVINRYGEYSLNTLYPVQTRDRTLVVCSGGLDSSVVAWMAHKDGEEVTLLHFLYSARAQGPEYRAVESLAAAMDCDTRYIELDFFEQFASSPLTTPDAPIAQGESGAEFAHEWVPARNTVMLALALAYAEKHGYTRIALGSNQEESCGGYPDNEQEFINKFRALMPYAVKPYCKIEFWDPLAGFMKKDIVTAGYEIGAPFELTWSCYKAGIIHCGDCGPCSMRKIAFKMAGVKDPTLYEVDKY